MRRFVKYALVLSTVLLATACGQNTKKDYPPGQSPAEINVELGMQYMREGMKQTALEKFQKALEQNPDLAIAHNAIAVLYESLGETDKADKHFRRATDINPKDSQAQNNYGNFLCRNNRWKDAEQRFLKAATDPLYPAPHMAYTNAGTCANTAKDIEKAELYWRKALEIDPKFAPALLQMARLNVQREEYLQARAYVQRLHAVARPSPDSLWLGIQTERNLGDKNAEASYILLLRNQYPESPQAKQIQDK